LPPMHIGEEYATRKALAQAAYAGIDQHLPHLKRNVTGTMIEDATD
jgi:hypothetical protein